MSKAVARAIDALRRGWPVNVGGLSVLAIETCDDDAMTAFAATGVLLSASRAATLKLTNQIDASGEGVLIEAAPWLDLSGARALADPALDLATPMKGPFRVLPLAETKAASAALELARLAGLLPAFLISNGEAECDVTVDDLWAYEMPDALRIVSRARLPVAGAEDATMVAFRGRDAGQEHVALIIGEPNGSVPLVRLHSECLTGDVFGSLKCDCGPQLQQALRLIGDSGWGMLLYLRQEGRGIGLINKLRAYQLQDQGFDTVDANLRLGLPVDARGYAIAARMLSLMGQDRVRLLTNNPAKVAGLEAAGIVVTERVPHVLPPNPHNVAYLDTKRVRTGHI
ncbi:GTP cyclohydrolase II [Sphingomonas antarctica]|uniref:GTP cyclohydrolase II n=1 Tax=Sphingomonas antarctica TaxID=2040274 RepID=UPI0039ECBA4B